MDILFGVLISGITEIIKFLSKKFGVAVSKKIVLSIVFILVFTFTYLQAAGKIPQELIKEFLTTLGIAVGTYQLITKPIKAKLINE